jgi:hypothetical protein
VLVTAGTVMAAMIAASAITAAAQDTPGTCLVGTVVGTNPVTGEQGCVAPNLRGCPTGTEPVRDALGNPLPICFGPFIEEEPPPPPPAEGDQCLLVEFSPGKSGKSETTSVSEENAQAFADKHNGTVVEGSEHTCPPEETAE